MRRLQRAVTISSLEQLTHAGRPLFLWVCEVESADETDPDAVALPALVARVRAVVSGHPDASERFEESLRSAGYEDRPEYERSYVRVAKAMCFRVDGTFPRLTREGVSAGIVGCRYELMVRALEPFIVPTWREASNRGNNGNG